MPTPALARFAGRRLRVVVREPEAVVTAYQKALTVELLDKVAPVISLQIQDAVPRRGAAVLNRLMAAYNQAAQAEKSRLTTNTLRFIDSRLVALRDELGRAEADVEGYRSQRGLTDLTSQSQAFVEDVQANDSRLNAARVQLAVVENLEQYLRHPSSSTTMPAALGINDPTLNSLLEKLTSLRLERERLAAAAPENNPLFRPLDYGIRSTELAISNSVKNMKASLTATIRELQAFNNRVKSAIKSIPEQERQLAGKNRQLLIKEKLYTYLLQKREEAALSYATTLTDARIIDRAYALPLKWTTRRWLLYALALGFGLLAPIAFLRAKDSWSPRLTTRTELKRLAQTPVLAELPLAAHAARPQDQAAPALAEQVRNMRSQLYYLQQTLPADTGQVVLVTSSVSGEGKSFVSAHLAASLADAGQKTVLVDLDLRRPKLTALFGLAADHAGVSDFLSGRAAYSAAVQPTAVSANLHLVGSGRQPAAALNLLATPRLDELVAGLRGAYDVIVLDTPPLHLVADALLAARTSDITLYVVRQGFTEKQELDFIEEVSQQGHLPRMHLIFNGVDGRRYGYGYSYDKRYLYPA